MKQPQKIKVKDNKTITYVKTNNLNKKKNKIDIENKEWDKYNEELKNESLQLWNDLKNDNISTERFAEEFDMLTVEFIKAREDLNMEKENFFHHKKPKSDLLI